jgi:hypothetical protein
LRQYLLHVMGIRPIRKITCTGLPGEGAGSQALMRLNAINFARFFGLTYVHTPFYRIAHAERPMKEWATAWETLFNLGAGESICDLNRHEVVNFCFTYTELDLCFRWCDQVDELADRFRDMIPELRRKYYMNKLPRNSDEVTVAVHIRRGDVGADDPGYFTSNEDILRTMTTVKSVLDARNVRYKMSVYSQGARAEFADLSMPGVELFLDVDAVWTMQELIEADILILSKGCFSYCAALISDGIKLFPKGTLPAYGDLPAWKWLSVPATESWVPCQADGFVNPEAFEVQLLLSLQTKAKAARKL